jgi:hypothetical protein
MAKFKSFIGKQVMLSASVFTFTDEIVSVEDQEVIAALSKAQDVEQLEEEKSKKLDK